MLDMKMNIYSLIVMLVLISGLSFADEWQEDRSKISCQPKIIGPADTLTIKMPVPHYKELAIYHPVSRSWWFLVYSPDETRPDTKPVMSSVKFAKTSTVKLKISTATGTLWEAGKNKDERIFQSPGIYKIYISEALETERGGYSCTVKYDPRKK